MQLMMVSRQGDARNSCGAGNMLRRQIGIAGALTLCAAIAVAPTQPRATVIHTVAWTVATVPQANADANAAFDPACAAPSIAVTNGDSRDASVFVGTDVSGGVTPLPIAMLVTSSLAADDGSAAGSQTARSVAAGSDGCDATCCASAAEAIPFVAGTAAFQVANFISGAVAAA